MKFRRRASTEPVPAETGAGTAAETGAETGDEDGTDVLARDDTGVDTSGGAEADATPTTFAGPYDADDLPDDGVGRVDLGSLLIPAVDGLELRLQVDDTSGVVQSVMLAGEDGAIEMRAFAAPRNGDLWGEVLPQLADDMAQRGGTSTLREGRFGPELVCEMPVQTPDGAEAVQPSRIIGINGSRWLLRATLLGRPAVEVETSQGWEEALAAMGVRRGGHAMPVGEPLDIELPEDAQRVAPGAES